MEYKFEAQFIKQIELDQKIMDKAQTTREATISQRLLAILVELGELANETRCFKYWSMRSASEQQIILEEYVDGIHFFLSVAIDLNESDYTLITRDKQQDLTTCFLNVYAKTSQLLTNYDYLTYRKAFSSYLQLAYNLGFNQEMIDEAYYLKNACNHMRQANNY